MKSDLNTMQYLSKQGKPLAKGVLSNMLTTAKNHLVQVQKTVTRAGKTFLQNFWIDPDDPEQMRKTADMLGSIAQPNSPFHRWNQTLSDKEYGFIKDYTSDAFYRELNALLRGTTPKKRGYTSDFNLEALKERATVIGAALDRFDLPQEIVTYRIMDDGFKDKLQVGDIIHDKLALDLEGCAEPPDSYLECLYRQNTNLYWLLFTETQEDFPVRHTQNKEVRQI